jgi:hypothetical protein
VSRPQRSPFVDFVFAAMLASFAAPAAAEQIFTGDVEAGVGYTDNLNLAIIHEDEVGAGLVFGSGLLVAAASVGRLEVSAELGLSGTRYQDYGDLSAVRAHTRIGLRRRLWGGWAEVYGLAAFKDYGDPARDAQDLAGGIGIGQRLSSLLAWRLEYRYQDHDADADTFDYEEHRGSILAVVGPAKIDVVAGYRLALSQSALYMTLEESRTPKGRGQQRQINSNSFGDNQVAYRDDTRSHIGLARLRYRPLRWLRLSLSYEIAAIVATDGTANTQEISTSLRIIFR